MSSQEIKDLELYINSHKDPQQRDYLNNLQDEDLFAHIENEKKFDVLFKDVKGKKLIIKNDIFNDNQRLVCSLYKDVENKGYILLRAGLMITRYKFIGKRGKVYKIDGIKSILNLEQIYRPKVDSNLNCITYNVTNLNRTITKDSYKFNGDILIVLDDWQKKNKSKSKYIPKLEIELKEEKKEIKLEIEDQDPIQIPLVEEPKELITILEVEEAEEDEAEEIEEEKVVEEKVVEEVELKLSYDDLLKLIVTNDEIIKQQNIKILNLEEDNQKFVNYHQLLVKENQIIEEKYNNLRKANSLLSRKYHSLNKRYKSITNKDFS